MNLFECNTKSTVTALLDCLNAYSFSPLITTATRITNAPTTSETLIDNIYSNVADTVINNCTVCYGVADHLGVLCVSNILGNVLEKEDTRPLRKKFNYAQIDLLTDSVPRPRGALGVAQCPAFQQ